MTNKNLLIKMLNDYYESSSWESFIGICDGCIQNKEGYYAQISDWDSLTVQDVRQLFIEVLIF